MLGTRSNIFNKTYTQKSFITIFTCKQPSVLQCFSNPALYTLQYITRISQFFENKLTTENHHRKSHSHPRITMSLTRALWVLPEDNGTKDQPQWNTCTVYSLIYMYMYVVATPLWRIVAWVYAITSFATWMTKTQQRSYVNLYCVRNTHIHTNRTSSDQSRTRIV